MLLRAPRVFLSVIPRMCAGKSGIEAYILFKALLCGYQYSSRHLNIRSQGMLNKIGRLKQRISIRLTSNIVLPLIRFPNYETFFLFKKKEQQNVSETIGMK